MSDQSERDFMHDLAGPLAVVQGLIRLTHKNLLTNETSIEPSELIDRLEKSMQALERVTEVMRKRRIYLDQSDAKDCG